MRHEIVVPHDCSTHELREIFAAALRGLAAREAYEPTPAESELERRRMRDKVRGTDQLEVGIRRIVAGWRVSYLRGAGIPTREAMLREADDDESDSNEPAMTPEQRNRFVDALRLITPDELATLIMVSMDDAYDLGLAHAEIELVNGSPSARTGGGSTAPGPVDAPLLPKAPGRTGAPALPSAAPGTKGSPALPSASPSSSATPRAATPYAPTTILQNPAAKEEIRKAAFDFATNVSDDQKAAIRKIILTAFEQHIPTRKVARQIEQLFADGVTRTREDGSTVTYDARSWSTMVARTEISRAQNTALMDRYRENDITKVRWIAAADACPECKAIDGTTVATGENFAIGVDRPPAHPRCFPAGTMIEAPTAILGGSKRHYRGTVVKFETDHGQKVTVTPNHPIATAGGWRAAGELEVGWSVHVLTSPRASLQRKPGFGFMGYIDGLFGMMEDREKRAVPHAASAFHGDGVGSTHADLRSAELVGEGYRRAKEAARGVEQDPIRGFHGSELAEITKVERIAYHGDVYNLETIGGWYYADGVVAHNCRCTLVAAGDDFGHTDDELEDAEVAAAS